eukprot:8845020-Pyramimonas_sp.AAC.1
MGPWNNQGPTRRWPSCLPRSEGGPPVRLGSRALLARCCPWMRWAFFNGGLALPVRETTGRVAGARAGTTTSGSQAASVVAAGQAIVARRGYGGATEPSSHPKNFRCSVRFPHSVQPSAASL